MLLKDIVYASPEGLLVPMVFSTTTSLQLESEYFFLLPDSALTLTRCSDFSLRLGQAISVDDMVIGSPSSNTTL